MRLIDMIVQAARRMDGETMSLDMRFLHAVFLGQFPDTKVGQSIDSFSATLNYHCVNMRSRFPDPRNKRAPASWMKEPYFKRIGIGKYKLLNATELGRFQELVAQNKSQIYADEFDADEVLGIAPD